jgi:hypothetical protein
MNRKQHRPERCVKARPDGAEQIAAEQARASGIAQRFVFVGNVDFLLYRYFRVTVFKFLIKEFKGDR